MNENTAKILKIVLSVAAVILGVFVAIKLSFYLVPFIIAFILSSIIEPVIRLMIRKTKISRKVAAPIALVLTLIIIGFVLVLVISKLVNEISDIIRILPDYFSQLYINLTAFISNAADIYEWLPEQITDNIGSVISNISTSIINILNSVVKGAFATAVSIPEALIFIIVTILSTYFLSSDRDKIYGFFRRQFPESWIDKIISIKNDMFSALFGYMRAQLILMSITFTELFFALTIIRVKYSLIVAFFTSIIDAFPILGTGTILIPWSLYELITGNIRMGVSLIIIYAIVLIVRQMIEPKIVGAQIGIYPLVTLIAMYSGLKLFGFPGLILGPILILLVKNILTGILKNRTVRELFDKVKLPEKKDRLKR